MQFEHNAFRSTIYKKLQSFVMRVIILEVGTW